MSTIGDRIPETEDWTSIRSILNQLLNKKISALGQLPFEESSRLVLDALALVRSALQVQQADRIRIKPELNPDLIVGQTNTEKGVNSGVVESRKRFFRTPDMTIETSKFFIALTKQLEEFWSLMSSNAIKDPEFLRERKIAMLKQIIDKDGSILSLNTEVRSEEIRKRLPMKRFEGKGLQPSGIVFTPPSLKDIVSREKKFHEQIFREAKTKAPQLFSSKSRNQSNSKKNSRKQNNNRPKKTQKRR